MELDHVDSLKCATSCKVEMEQDFFFVWTHIVIKAFSGATNNLNIPYFLPTVFAINWTLSFSIIYLNIREVQS